MQRDSNVDLASSVILSKTLFAKSGWDVSSQAFYYLPELTKVSSIEAEARCGEDQTVLANLTFGSEETVNIRTTEFVDDIFLVIKMPTLNATTTSNHLEEGWGFNAIYSLEWNVGGISPIVIDGIANFHAAMIQCPTAEKRKQLMMLAGRASSALSGANPEDEHGFPDPNFEPTACVPLMGPFTSTVGAPHKKPIPMDMIAGKEITLKIKLRVASEFIFGTGTYKTISRPINAYVVYRKVTPTSSLSKEVNNSISRGYSQLGIYQYPYADYSVTTKDFLINTGAAINTATVQINGIHASDLLAVTASLHCVDSNTAGTDGRRKSMYITTPVKLYNVVIRYSGHIIFDSRDGRSDLALSTGRSIGAVGWTKWVSPGWINETAGWTAAADNTIAYATRSNKRNFEIFTWMACLDPYYRSVEIQNTLKYMANDLDFQFSFYQISGFTQRLRLNIVVHLQHALGFTNGQVVLIT